MNYKNKIILITILCITGIFAILLYPRIIITINNPISEIEVFNNYIEENVTCKTGNIITGYKKCTYTKTNDIDTSKLGTYKITYTYKSKSITKIVRVVDKIPPTITIDTTNIKVCPNEKNIPIKYSAYDNYDKEITNKVKKEIINNILVLKVEDSSHNKTQITTNVEYIDNEKPKILLQGNNPMYIMKNEEYKEPGYTITDNCDKEISNKVKIESNIDNKKVGTYKITYTTEDENKNTTTTYRTVNVIDKYDEVSITNNDKTIYLTFDDGPGQYTEELLKILKKYNVKATFFVTNQFPKYSFCIKKAHDEGHAIALHTYSHKWSIYQNENTYFDDLNKINEVVKKQTGNYTKLIRFPGGSGNTVSKKYNIGIMTKLTKEVQNRGYIYFDWNVLSGDTNTKDSNVVYENVIKSLKKNNKVNVILMHDIKKHTVNAVPKIIEYGLANNFKFQILSPTSPTTHGPIRN